MGMTVTVDTAVAKAIATTTSQTEHEILEAVEEMLAAGWLKILDQSDGVTTYALTIPAEVAG